MALATLLSDRRRIYAVDMMGDAGYSTPGDHAVQTSEDLVEYLDTVLDGLGLTSAELCGHSFGAWIALTYGSRVHQVQQVAKRSGRLPKATVETVAGASHYGCCDYGPAIDIHDVDDGPDRWLQLVRTHAGHTCRKRWSVDRRPLESRAFGEAKNEQAAAVGKRGNRLRQALGEPP